MFASLTVGLVACPPPPLLLATAMPRSRKPRPVSSAEQKAVTPAEGPPPTGRDVDNNGATDAGTAARPVCADASVAAAAATANALAVPPAPVAHAATTAAPAVTGSTRVPAAARATAAVERASVPYTRVSPLASMVAFKQAPRRAFVVPADLDADVRSVRVPLEESVKRRCVAQHVSPFFRCQVLCCFPYAARALKFTPSGAPPQGAPNAQATALLGAPFHGDMLVETMTWAMVGGADAPSTWSFTGESAGRLGKEQKTTAPACGHLLMRVHTPKSLLHEIRRVRDTLRCAAVHGDARCPHPGGHPVVAPPSCHCAFDSPDSP